jgi:dTDP-4-amino-4,6-dideoxygalactose transaminase
MCPTALAEACRLFQPSAVIATHLWGQLVDMRAVCDVASAHGMRVIEDCAQAHGARLADRRAGSWGEVGCFSFYPTKNLGALGDAGAIVTSSDELAARVRMLRQYGWGQKYKADLSGGRNSRMDELQAAVLRRFLPRLDAWNDRRRQIAESYRQLVSNPRVESLAGSEGSYVAHLYIVRCADRDSLKTHLASRGIASDIHYPVPDHLQQCNGTGWRSLGLPITERLASEILTLPCYPELTDTEVETIALAVNEWG